ncbi:MAG: heavy-metal-associated domain-containing protein [Chloroflexi bacterium]|nr:heavy-metal-associated domain-containing protein [Chloroflexota bacterium]
MATEITLEVPAIHCESCVKTITQTLQALPTVVIADADPLTKLVRLEFDESAVSIGDIREALDEVGFSAED